MQEATSILYAQIIKFVQGAISWYSEGKFKHALTAMARPFPLRFKDTMDEISEQSRRLERLAFTLLSVELRETRLELRESLVQQHGIKSALDGQSFANFLTTFVLKL